MPSASAFIADLPKPRRLARAPALRFRPRLPRRSPPGERPGGGQIRAALRFAGVLALTALAIPLQLLLLLAPRYQGVVARGFGRAQCWLLGVRLKFVGRPAGGATLYVSNHCSWLDVPVLMARVDARFVAKAELAHWPLFGLFARLGGTIFVSRKRQGTGAEAEAMTQNLAAGHGLILFPEGTTSDGARVLPFRSSFFAVAGQAARVQPLTVVYDRAGGLPACRRDRPITAWYGDMETASHAWSLLRRTGIRATLVLHEAFPPAHLPNRKTMAIEVGRVVSMSAAALRQNRPAVPLAAPARHPH
jgi:1-acyl-sn-glycerol-3-phosphate acyltransferase